CATHVPLSTPTVQNQQSWDERQRTLSQLTHWHSIGALAIQTAKGNDALQFDWQLQSENDYSLRFIGPVGTGYGTLKTTPKESVYFAPKGKTYVDRNAEALLPKVTGWQLPVNNLYYWARGLPAPGSTANLQFDNSHSYLTGLHQDGFDVIFQNYSGVGKVDLPSKLLIQNADVKVKIVVTRWQLS
ncbi:MAG: lolB, partial [Gammaproteobacteria bacterium]|nr:lolB [Gammaproteobacteria bacterium]